MVETAHNTSNKSYQTFEKAGTIVVSLKFNVSRIRRPSDVNLDLSLDLSFFDPYLQYWIKEILEIGGESYVSRNSENNISGLFLYDDHEKIGTICTRSRGVFDYFYNLKPFKSVFAEIPAEHENEIYDIYTTELADSLVHTFSYEISIAEEEQLPELEQFMVSTHPGINRRWVDVALKNGEKCFMVRLDNEIAGVGWLSLVNGVGRLHSFFVKPRFRKIGIGMDILFARLFWLKSKTALMAFSEISRNSPESSKIALKGGMKVSGQVFQYFKSHANMTRPVELAKFI